MRNLALLVAALVVGCNDSTVSVGNDNPTGVVGGLIIDAAGQTPLAGASVQLTTAGGSLSPAVTDDQGQFHVPKVPSGTVIVTISQMGYETTVFTAFLNGAVGNFPVKNPSLTLGPIGLVKNDYTFAVRIVDETGAPAKDVKVIARPQVRHIDFSSGDPIPVGSYAVTGSSGADGLVTFSGLPNYPSLGQLSSDIDQLFIDVPPTKVMGSEVYSFAGLTTSFAVNHLLTVSTPTITLAGPKTTLQILQANISHLVNQVSGPQGSLIPANGPITITFNQAINPATVRVRFTDDQDKPSPIQPTAVIPPNTGNLLSISPSVPFTAGARYNLQLHADALGVADTTARELNRTSPFFVPAAATTITGTAKLDTTPGNSLLTVTLSEPVGLGSGNTQGATCVAFYDPPVSFDGLPDVYQGEFDPDPNKLSCPIFNPPLASPQVDVTGIQSLETGIFTGFSARWLIHLGDYAANSLANGCKGPATACVQPISGNKLHFVFSKQAAGNTFRRVNGTPADDKTIITIQ
jgi:hypothetical protein